MPHEHLPGPRARLKPNAMSNIAASDPELQRGPQRRPNITAIARTLRTTRPTLSRMEKGQLPVNLEVVVAHVASQRCWCAAGDLIEVLDERGNAIPMRPCGCTEHEPVAA